MTDGTKRIIYIKGLKKIFCLTLILLFCSGCSKDIEEEKESTSREVVESTMPYMIRVQDDLYICIEDNPGLEFSDVSILGTIKSVCEEGLKAAPSENEQTNVITWIGMSYGEYDNHIYLYVNGKWRSCWRSYSGGDSFMADGKVYNVNTYPTEVEKDPEILGIITSYNEGKTKYATENNQCSQEDWVGASYGLYRGEMHLYYNGDWLKCYDVTNWAQESTE